MKLHNCADVCSVTSRHVHVACFCISAKPVGYGLSNYTIVCHWVLLSKWDMFISNYVNKNKFSCLRLCTGGLKWNNNNNNNSNTDWRTVESSRYEMCDVQHNIVGQGVIGMVLWCRWGCSVEQHQSRCVGWWQLRPAPCHTDVITGLCDLCLHSVVRRGGLPRRLWCTSTSLLPTTGKPSILALP